MAKRIGIITCFNKKNVNYGNRLQAYALNKYLRMICSETSVETLQFSESMDYICTSGFDLLRRLKNKIRRKIYGESFYSALRKRLEKCNTFSDYNISLSKPINKNELENLSYDILIVGSDVVWYQEKGIYKPVMFLDFDTKQKTKKVAYAASFGTDYIPEKNRKYIKESLDLFDAISVREKSSISLLENIGISNAIHCIDPTLLLEREEWISLEEPIKKIEESNFIFVYLLGKNKADRIAIKKIAKEMNCIIVTVPYARGWRNSVDNGFGDIQLMDCSPEQWLWLVHHSSYVITDSFHGVVFSTIYKKRFIVVDRKEFGINNRLKDFLSNINQTDKFVNIDNLNTFEEMKWNYCDIDERISVMKHESIKYIKDALV